MLLLFCNCFLPKPTHRLGIFYGRLPRHSRWLTNLVSDMSRVGQCPNCRVGPKHSILCHTRWRHYQFGHQLRPTPKSTRARHEHERSCRLSFSQTSCPLSNDEKARVLGVLCLSTSSIVDSFHSRTLGTVWLVSPTTEREPRIEGCW